MLHYFSKLIKKNLLTLKYLSTISLIDDIVCSISNEKLIKKINKASLKTLNQDISMWYNYQFSFYHYKNSHSPSTVLEAILANSNEEVLKAFLDKNTTLDINYHNPLSKIFQRSIVRNNIKLRNIFIMTQMLLDKGLNLNWFEDNEDYSVYNSKINNYLNEAIMASVNYIDIGQYEINHQFLKLFYMLIDKGLKKQESVGQLIQTAILIGNNELTNIILNLKEIDDEYIKKGLAKSLHYMNTNETAIIQPIIAKNKASMDFINMYMEKKNLEKLTTSAENDKIISKKHKL